MLGVKRDALISNGGYAGSGGRGDVFDISWMESGRLKVKFMRVIT